MCTFVMTHTYEKKRETKKKGLDAAHVILKWKVSGQRPFSIARDVSKV